MSETLQFGDLGTKGALIKKALNETPDGFNAVAVGEKGFYVRDDRESARPVAAPETRPGVVDADDVTEMRERADRLRQEKAAQDARRAVQEALGMEGLSEPEAKLLELVLRSASDVLIQTDLPPSTSLRFGEESILPDQRTLGFQVFGSSERVKSGQAYRLIGEFFQPRDSYGGAAAVPEAYCFQSEIPGKNITEIVQEVSKGWLGREKAVRVSKPRYIPPQPMPEVVNPETGSKEPGVLFQYSFSTQSNRGYDGQVHYATNSGRPGNVLGMNALLPSSVAEQLQSFIRNNPQVLRELVHQLVVEEGGVPEAVWAGTASTADGKKIQAVRPPYDELPKGWEIREFGNSPYTHLNESMPVLHI